MTRIRPVAHRRRRGQPPDMDRAWAKIVSQATRTAARAVQKEDGVSRRLTLLLAGLFSLVLHGGLVLVLFAGKPGLLGSGTEDGPAAAASGDLGTEPEVSCLLLEPAPTNPQVVALPPPAPLPPPPEPRMAPGEPSSPTVPPDAPPSSGAPAASGLPQPGASGREPAGPGTTPGGRGTTAFFQIGTSGRSVVYVIDRSGSMGLEGRLGVARQELIASLQRLPPIARFQVIVYNRYVEPMRVGGRIDWLDATDENKRQVVALLDNIVPEGNTEHLPALKRALAYQPDVIYFLTDADDLRPEEVNAVTQLNRGRASINTIELNTLNRDREDMPLHVLAHANRGVYRAVEMVRGQ